MTVFTESQLRLYEKLHQDLGVQINPLLRDSDVHEIMLNPDGQLWVDSEKNGQISVGKIKLAQTFSIMSSIAGIHGFVVSQHHPRLEAELPHFENMQGERFTGIIPPIVTAPCFTIRKRGKKIFTLDDYVKSQRLPPSSADILRSLVRERKNILVCGGPGSGKTTMTNALIHEAVMADQTQRFIILEDVPELQCKAPNAVTLLTAASLTMRDLLHAAMRLRPDRILIGEVRGPEALDMLKAWNTGCPGGICTTHANGAEEALQRIADLAMETGLTQPPWALLQHALDAVVAIERRGSQKGFLKKIVRLNGRKNETFVFETLE